jgi:hypothetical protein
MRQVESIERTMVLSGSLRDRGSELALQNCDMKKTPLTKRYIGHLNNCDGVFLQEEGLPRLILGR